MNSFQLFAVLTLLGCSALADEAIEKVLGKAPGRDAKVMGATPKDGAPSLTVVSDGEVIWKHTLMYGYPESSVVSWSPYSSKVAISVRTTKTTSEIHVFDVWDTKKEIKVPDLAAATLAMVGGIKGRHFLVTPVGWSGENNLLIEISGNLVDSLSEGDEEMNYTYIFTVNLLTGRVISAVCTSQHSLNNERIAKPTDQE